MTQCCHNDHSFHFSWLLHVFSWLTMFFPRLQLVCSIAKNNIDNSYHLTKYGNKMLDVNISFLKTFIFPWLFPDFDSISLIFLTFSSEFFRLCPKFQVSCHPVIDNIANKISKRQLIQYECVLPLQTWPSRPTSTRLCRGYPLHCWPHTHSLMSRSSGRGTDAILQGSLLSMPGRIWRITAAPRRANDTA